MYVGDRGVAWLEHPRSSNRFQDQRDHDHERSWESTGVARAQRWGERRELWS